MATNFAGLRATNDAGTDERPKDFRKGILTLEPNGRSPMLALSAMFKSEGTTDPEFSWWEEESYVPRCITTGALNKTSTAVTLQAAGTTGTKGDGLSFVVGDLLLVEKAYSAGAQNQTNEIVEVSAVTNATTITIVRGAAGTTTADIATATFLTKIGNAFAEGTTSPTVASRNPTKYYNYTQIFKTAFESTRTQNQTTMRTGDSYKQDRARKMFDHGAALEMATIFGVRYEQTSGTSNNKPRRYMGGLLDANIGIGTIGFATTPTEDALLDAMEPCFQQTAPGINDERIGFCGNGFINAINKKIKNAGSTRFQFEKVLTIFGMELMQFVTPFGRIAFKTHPLLTHNGRYTNSCLMVHPQLYRYRDLQPTKFQDDIQAPDSDTRKGQWLTETGLEVRFRSLMKHFHILDATQ